MDKFFLILLFLISSMFSCKQKQELKYFYVSAGGGNYQFSDTDIVFKIENIQTKDTIKMFYYCQRDTLGYLLLKDNRDSSKIINSYHHYEKIRPLLDTIVIIDKDTFNVTEYISNEDAMDGSYIHYYCPRFGIFIKHSGTWPGIKYLQTSDSTINRKIVKLLKAIVPDFFIRGKLKDDL